MTLRPFGSADIPSRVSGCTAVQPDFPACTGVLYIAGGGWDASHGNRFSWPPSWDTTHGVRCSWLCLLIDCSTAECNSGVPLGITPPVDGWSWSREVVLHWCDNCLGADTVGETIGGECRGAGTIGVILRAQFACCDASSKLRNPNKSGIVFFKTPLTVTEISSQTNETSLIAGKGGML